MRKSKVDYKCRQNFEALVFSAAKQLFDGHYTLPANRGDSDMYREHPKFWPLQDRSLRQPSSKRGKGFDGLTYPMREWLKSVLINGPEEIKFGLKVLAWWHREIWQTGLARAEHRTYGEYMRNFLATMDERHAYLSLDGLATMRNLYGTEVQAVA